MQLESSIKALTVRLTLTESKLEATVQKQSNSVLNFESTFKKSDREATLETQLVKAKRDKDKAVRYSLSLTYLLTHLTTYSLTYSLTYSQSLT